MEIKERKSEVVINVYVAEDGSEFNNEKDCVEYEKLLVKVAKKKYVLKSTAERYSIGYGMIGSSLDWELFENFEHTNPYKFGNREPIAKGGRVSYRNDNKFRDWREFVRAQGIETKDVVFMRV